MTSPFVLRVARALSFAFHPLFMPLLTLYLAINTDINIGYLMNDEVRQVIYLMVGIMTVIFPLLSVILLLRSKMITSLQMPNKEERILPFGMTLFYYCLCYFLLRNTPLDESLYTMMVGAIVALLLALLITFRWKISVHMVGFGGLVGAMVGLMIIHRLELLPLLCVLIITAGLVGTARLVLGSHTPAQVYTGAVLGAVCVCISVVSRLMI